MGAEFSLPVPPSPPLNVFCLIFCPFTKIRLLHAPPEVEAVVLRVVNNIESLKNYGYSDISIANKEKMGATQFTMSSSLFTTNNGKQAATLGKQLCVELLQELYKLGWDLELSSDLARSRWQAAALFFRKTSVERPGARVVCVAPGKHDMLTLLNHDHRAKNKVVEAIQETWPTGIQEAQDCDVLGLMLHDIKMNGNPWYTSEANVDDNRIICRIISKLSEINLKLVAGINIKGGTDSLFFIQDSALSPILHKTEFCAISLCQHNRLRLVDCKEMCNYVEQVITRNQYQIKDKSVREHHAKLKLNGSPWHCSGYESVKSRQLISRISESMLKQGWALTDALDNSRREDDKSMLLYRRCPPTTARFCCISLTSSDHLRLIDFPSSDQEILSRTVTEHYLPGIEKVDNTESCSLKFSLAGSPWSDPSGSGLGWALHARSMLLHLLNTSHQLGYRLAVSADVSAKYQTDGDGNPEYPLDVHTIYLVKQDYNAAPPSYESAISDFRDDVFEFIKKV